jgi:hypothetical protein
MIVSRARCWNCDVRVPAGDLVAAMAAASPWTCGRCGRAPIIRPVNVVVEAPIVADARSAAAQTEATPTVQTAPNPTGLDLSSRYFIGYLGELIVASVFDEIGVAYTHSFIHDGQSHPDRFQVAVAGKPVNISVNTAGEAHYQRMMFPAGKEERESPAVYIAVRLEGETEDIFEASVWGFMLHEDAVALPVADFGHDIPTKHIMLRRLTPLAQFTDTLDRRTV